MIIVVLLVSLIVSLAPSIMLYRWFIKKSDDKKYKEICKESFKKGIFSVLFITLTSLAFAIIGIIFKLLKINPIIYQAYYTFIVLALSEELIKFLTFKKVIKKNKYKYNWYNLTIFMTIVGLGFGCIENATYSFGSGIIVMLLKGISIGHAGYGFIMGWFYSKMLETKKKVYGVLSFIIPWLLHGLYDFGLSKEVMKANDNIAFIPVILELVCIIFVFIIIRFVKKRQNDSKYTKTLKVV
ncbi:MAG: PrsW family intramembrane metalloprotease [Bacilli bacterium]|nr:PrsW family intramembrane metalloprotease [Bacilli bacterium]